jgi:AcrR family transcriptional regulator
MSPKDTEEGTGEKKRRRKNKPRRQTLDNRRKILDTTARLIISKGVQNISLSDIANEVGISKGTLYYYYSSKADLIYEITEHHVGRITENLMKWIDTVGDERSPEEILVVVVKIILGTSKRGKLHHYLIHEALTNNQPLLSRYKDTYRQWKEMLNAGLSRVFHDDKDHSVLGETILMSIDGIIIQNMLGIRTPSVKELVQTLLRTHIEA